MLSKSLPVIPILCNMVQSFFRFTRLYALFMSMFVLKICFPCCALLVRSIFVPSMARVEELPFCEPIWRLWGNFLFVIALARVSRIFSHILKIVLRSVIGL